MHLNTARAPWNPLPNPSSTWPQRVPSKLSCCSHKSWRCDEARVAICKAIKTAKSGKEKIKLNKKGSGRSSKRGEGAEQQGEGKTRHSHAHNSIGSNKSTFNFIYYRPNVRESVRVWMRVCLSASVNHVILWMDVDEHLPVHGCREISVRYFHSERQRFDAFLRYRLT